MAATASHGAQGCSLRLGASGGGQSHVSSSSEEEARRACDRPEASLGTKRDPLRSYWGVKDPSGQRKTNRATPSARKSSDFPLRTLSRPRTPPAMATFARWLPPAAAPPAAGPAAAPAARPLARRRIPRRAATVVSPRAFGRADFDGFVRRAWQGANAGAERLAFEARQAAQRLDGRFSISRRLAEASRAARERAVEIDAELGIGRRWRSFSVDFSRNWPRYRRELNDFMATPIGRALATLFFLWLALSGWLFRIFIFGTFVLPFAAPLFLGTFANRVAIEGTCPACKRRFVGYRSQVIRCMNCQNIVWQPNNSSSGGARSSRRAEADVIDVEYEEK